MSGPTCALSAWYVTWRHLDDFLVDVIRATPGVRSTSARLAFGGVVRANVITELPLQDSAYTRRAAAAVFVKTEPGRDRQVYAALTALPAHPEVQVAWVLKVFHSPEADIKMLVAGRANDGSDRVCHELGAHGARRGGYTVDGVCWTGRSSANPKTSSS